MKYDSVLDQQSITGKIVSLILCVWKPCYMKSGHIYLIVLNTKTDSGDILSGQAIHGYHSHACFGRIQTYGKEGQK